MVRFELLVDGETVTRDLELQAFPEEQVAGARVIYDSIETVNGRQRTLLTLPDEAEQPPVVYILQGFGCASIDLALSQDQSLITLVDTLNSEGYATYRVEKTGLGDSEGRSCLEIGFDDETAGFAQGLQVLQQTEAVDTSRVYLLGISLGGVWAPMLAADTEVAGIMSFSTIAKTWPEYMYDNWRRQWELAGRSYGDIDRDLKLANLFWQQLITEGRSPSEIFSAYPETASLQTALAHDTSNENILSRHYTFVREFASTNIMSYWEAVDVPTLLLWGRGDYVASESDQQIIFRALQRRDVDVELRYLDTDHYWRIAADFLSSYRGLRDGERAPLQETVYENVVAWLTRTDAARKS
jgi:pimeloyl-ACP methyl ester carboxylesterase